MNSPTIFLLTDFGIADQYTAVMKAVILSRQPRAIFVDITHNVAPQAIEQGEYLLESVWPWLPPGDIVLAVVDPGVGTDREPAIFAHEGRYFIGPNNGLFGFLPSDAEGRTLDRPEFWIAHNGAPLSATFHGRDVFAPCAAYLAGGGDWRELGDNPARPYRLEFSDAPDDLNTGRIIHFDHFGNAITTIRRGDFAESDTIKSVEIVGKLRCPFCQTFGDVANGKPLAYWGSTNRLEIAVRGGSAQARLHLELHESVQFETERSSS